MPDCWLAVSTRKVLRPATSTKVSLGFPVSISKCSDGSQHSKLPLHASHVFRFTSVYKQMLRWFPKLQVATTCFSCSPPDLNLLVTNLVFCIHVKQPLPPGDNTIAVNTYYYYVHNTEESWSRPFQVRSRDTDFPEKHRAYLKLYFYVYIPTKLHLNPLN